jgi:hypothetical protein
MPPLCGSFLVECKSSYASLSFINMAFVFWSSSHHDWQWLASDITGLAGRSS